MKRQRKLSALMIGAALFLSALVLLAGTCRTVDAAAKVTVKKVASVNTLTESKTIKLAKGKKATLKTTVTVTPNKSANKKVTYKSSNTKVATVTSKGVITGKKAGTAKITVTSAANKKIKATVTVKVVTGKVTSVKLNKTSGTLTAGDTAKLTATVKTSAGGSKDLVWSTSNKKVATVTSKGTVKAVAAGTATITAKAADGTGKKATYKVTVKKASNTISFAKDKISSMYVNDEADISVVCSSSKHGEISWKISDTSIIDFTPAEPGGEALSGEATGETVRIMASEAGTATIKVTVDGKSISQKIKVTIPQPQYTYEINFLSQPYSFGAFNIVYVKTDNPSADNFSLQFYDVATGKSNRPMYIVGACKYADLKSMGAMTPSFLYKTDGGYLGVFAFMLPGKCKVTVQEFLCDANGDRITYNDYRGYPVIAEAGEGYIDIKDTSAEQTAWMQSVIDQVTTSSMTKQQKMEAITYYMRIHSIYSKVPADGSGGYVYLAAESGIPFWKFPVYEFNSYSSPALLTAFGEMIGYPLENLYYKYPVGTVDWYQWHMVAQSIEDGTCYQFCPSSDTNIIDTSTVAQIDLSKWDFYKWYK